MRDNVCLTGRRVTMPAGIELTLVAEDKIVLSKDDRILSLGCGTGEIESYLVQKYGCEVVGIDIDEAQIKVAIQKAGNAGLSERLHFQVADAANLPFSDASFDIVYSSGALSEFFEKGVQEIDRLLKKTGKAIIIDLVYASNDIPGELCRYWEERGVVVLTADEMNCVFQGRGFNALYSRVYFEPLWWDAYFSECLEHEEYWLINKDLYRKYKYQLGVGLFLYNKGFEQFL